MEELIQIVGIVLLLIVALMVAAAVVALSMMIITIAAVAGVVMGVFYALRSMAHGFAHNLNPANYTSGVSDEPARQGYLFGPVFSQLRDSLREIYQEVRLSGLSVLGLGEQLYVWGAGITGAVGTGVRALARVFQGASVASVYFGSLMASMAVALLIAAVSLGLAAVITVVFAIVWLTDTAYLLIYRIRADCPFHKGRYLVPAFLCPDCEAVHRKLRPNTYGVFTHRCSCGRTLPCTCFNGRSALVPVCPEPGCGAELVSSSCKPVCFQLLGGPFAGKTVFLISLCHELLEAVRAAGRIRCEIPERYQPSVQMLERYYESGVCPRTTEDLNARMYPFLLSGEELRPPRHFYLYDIGGEMFNGEGREGIGEQKQYGYADGFLLVVDPLSDGFLRREGVRQEMASSTSPVDVLNNLNNYLISAGMKKADERYQIPVAVLIVKSDIPEVREYFTRAESMLGDQVQEADRADAVCRRFLQLIEMQELLIALERHFKVFRLFAVTAMGHGENCEAYQPQGVMEPVRWLLSLSDEVLCRSLESGKGV